MITMEQVSLLMQTRLAWARAVQRAAPLTLLGKRGVVSEYERQLQVLQDMIQAKMQGLPLIPGQPLPFSPAEVKKFLEDLRAGFRIKRDSASHRDVAGEFGGEVTIIHDVIGRNFGH